MTTEVLRAFDRAFDKVFDRAFRKAARKARRLTLSAPVYYRLPPTVIKDLDLLLNVPPRPRTPRRRRAAARKERS